MSSEHIVAPQAAAGIEAGEPASVAPQVAAGRLAHLLARSSMETKVKIGFVGAFVVLLVGGALAYRTIDEAGRSARRVQATLEIQTRLNQVDAAVSDAETAERDYFLTGNAHYKVDCGRLAAQAHRDVEAVAALIASNSSQRRTVERLEAVLAARLGEIEQMMAVFDAKGRDAAVASLNTGRGVHLMDAVDDVLRELTTHEATLLVESQARAAADQQYALLAMVLTLVWAAGVFLVLLHSIRREAAARAGADERNRRLTAQLLRQVEVRTAALEATDAALAAADAANRAKSVFLATMSHEIRTPMNGVIGMVEVLARSELAEAQKDAVSIIRASAFSLLGLIDDILDFSKIEAGKMELERTPVPLSELIEGVCQTLSPLAINKGVDLNVFIAPQVPDRVWSDATRLRQVLYNLAGNAIKFSSGRPGHGGKVSVRAAMTDEPLPRLTLQITDNGIGMSPETLGHLFSSFLQAETSTTRRFGGTGLGLAICKRLVTLMEGRIEVHSKLEEGSTFTVTLPVERVEGDDAHPIRYDDLSGLDCIVVGKGDAAADGCRYLACAGARVHAVPSLALAAEEASRRPNAVVLHWGWRPDSSLDLIRTWFSATPGMPHVLVLRGRDERSSVAVPGISWLDGSCLRRAVLLQAVAIASGRIEPEAAPTGGKDTSRATAGPLTVAEARAEGRLLLVAEDDEVNRKVISRQIQLLGYAAEIAADGVEALRLWRTGSFGLLLTDLHMPEMDGYTLSETIRREEAVANPRRQRMPILALTANAIRSEALKAQEAGMDEYLTKPLQLVQLSAALTKWLPQSQSESLSGDVTAVH